MNRELFSLTNPQKSILLTEEFYKGTAINNICGTATINDVIDFDLLKAAINLVAKNNDSFNLKLVLDNNEVKQCLCDSQDIDVEIVDISSIDEVADIENTLMKHIFDIYNSPLYCFKIFRLPNGTGGFMLNIHHLFADSWTLGLTAREIVRTYSCLKNGEDVSKNEDFSYVNYIYSEKEYLSSDKFIKDKAYWDGVFETIPEQASIPGSIENTNTDFSCKANRKVFNIDTTTMDKINEFCRNNNVSSFNFFMAIYAIYIGRVSNLDDFVIGTPILNRTNFKEKNTTGMFINTAPLRVNIDNNSDFKSFVCNIAKDSLAMLRHQKYYYQNILEDLRKKDPSLPNLYNVIISYQVTKANTENGLSYDTRWAFNGYTADDLDVHLYDLNDSGSLDIAYDYKVSKYDEKDICDMHNRIMHIVNQILNCDGIKVCDIEVVTNKEKYDILYKFNHTDADYPKDKTVIDLFEKQVKNTPDNIAVVFKNEQLTYKELNDKANKLANYLCNLNINKSSIIAVCMNKNIEFIVSILAIQKLGCAYVPILPDYPIDRIHYIVKNSKCVLLITDRNLNIDTSQININSINYDTMQNTNIDINFTPDCLSYVIYTSGSTGEPKGVMLTHKNLINFIYSFNYMFDKKFSSSDVCLSLTNISFDVSVCEIFTPLVFGASLVLYPENTLTSIPLLYDIIVKNNVTFLYIPPNILDDVYNYIIMQDNKTCINKLLVGVEPIKYTTLNQYYNLNNNIEIVNGYGPTETTICCTFYKWHYNVNASGIVPIGSPLKNNSIYILGNSGSIQPIGITGEIYVCGNNVALGYLNNQDLTNKNFISNFLDTSLPAYKTGDLAYWNSDGTITFIGRKDSQIKLNGHRIELGEINTVLKQLKGIDNAVTVVKSINGQNHICSYIISDLSIEYIKNYLKKLLPYYMIPNYIQKVNMLPVTPNGKIDIKNLPIIDVGKKTCRLLPSTNNEKSLFKIISDILGNTDFGINDNFINLGLDSLCMIRLSTRLLNDLNINISMKDIINNPSIYELSQLIDNKNALSIDNSIKKVIQNMDTYPLSSAQQRIYYACKKLGNNTLTYNVSGGLLIDCILDKDKVINCIKTVVARHDVFRTIFTINNGQLCQKLINDEFCIPVYNASLSDLDEILNTFQKPFDLEKDLLLRCNIYFLDNEKTLLLIDSHHIAIDGVSMDIFIREFCELYNDKKLDELDLDYKDFAVWEHDFINSDKIKDLENYWLTKFQGSSLPSINLPYDYVGINANSSEGRRVNFQMDADLFTSYENLAKEMKVSSYTLFLSALFVLLYKYTNQDELIVGSATVGRENSKLYDIIGTFVNNIVLDAKMKPNQSFADFVKYINSQVLDDLAHQAYPYDLLVKKLAGNGHSYNGSLFDVSFTYQNANKSSYNIDNKEVKILDIYSNTAKFNLLLEIRPKDYIFSFEYNSSLFKKETIESLLEHYLFILEQIYKNIDISIDNIDIVTKRELKLLEQFNDTFDEVNDDTFVSIFENEVKNNPDNIALICNDKTLTYNELNKKANSLAHYLIKYGIGANDIVCIMTNRSLETIVCMLGILKSGAAFFNVDPTYPIERTKYYIENSKTKYVLTQRELKDKVNQIENCIEIDLDNDAIYGNNFDNPNVNIGMNDLSYIIYTSGSTGTPKGVMLNQVGLANMVKAMTKVLDYLKEGNRHTIVSVTSTPFDIFVYEIVVSLAHGLKVVMANNAEHRNPKLLDALIRKHNVDVMTVTPSLMKINYDNREPNSALALVKNMVFGGEPLPEKFVKDLKALADDITIYNIYGPSEITVLSNVQNLDGENEITVGPPIMNTQIHILDKNMRRVPIGVVGEIYISGIQVGYGYIGKPEMTAEKFMDNPFGDGKIYRSGDIGRWTFDGKVQILGRVDHQIKLRGLRIELGEIENIMQNINNVTASVVNKIEIDGKEVLCGYYVADSSIQENDVKDILRKALPYYMVPTYIIRLDKMPYSINRKIDRKALPLPKLEKSLTANTVNIGELNSNSEKLLQIWKNILHLDNIDVNDNFFDIGGDSISAISMQIEALKYGLDFEYADIFNYPTIAQLTSKLPSPISNFMTNYDYSRVNEVLNRNTLDNLNTIKKFNINSVLLIGATGYLGAHIIDEFMKNTTATIYCLIRPKDNRLPIDRLKEILNFYFKDKYDNNINNRLKVVCGDITKENLGLSSQDYAEISKNVNIIINSGAIVKHFGLKDDFENINVKGTQNVVDFCMREKKRLLHISTISISGNGEKEETVIETPDNINDKKLFYENDIFINQNINGIYTTTKYKAELIVLEAIYNGLDAQILRLGNITNRYSDGLFQLNVEDNAFAKRLKSFIEIGAFPKYLLEHAIELTPVDLCANAILKIAQHYSICNVFHLYNPKLLPIKLLVDTLSDMGIELEGVSDNIFANIINGILNDDKQKDILSGIIYDFDRNNNLVYTSNVRIKYDFSEQYLNKIGFYWSDLDKIYIKKYINYFKRINFIK